MYAQAIDATGVEYDTLRQEVYVSGSVEFVLRNTNLSWSHHYAVAPLPEDEQREWLEYAETEKIGANEFAVRTANLSWAPQPL